MVLVAPLGLCLQRERGYSGSRRVIAGCRGSGVPVPVLQPDTLRRGLWGHGGPRRGLLRPCFWRRKKSPDGQGTPSMAEAALPPRGVSPPCRCHGPRRAPTDALVGRGRRGVPGWRCFCAGRHGLQKPPGWHRAMLIHGSPQPAVLWSCGRPSCRSGGGRCSEGGRGRLRLNTATLKVKRVGLSAAQESQGPGGGATWTNTSFQEMLETRNQLPVIQHLNGVKGTGRDKGHRSTRTQPSINPG